MSFLIELTKAQQHRKSGFFDYPVRNHRLIIPILSDLAIKLLMNPYDYFSHGPYEKCEKDIVELICSSILANS